MPVAKLTCPKCRAVLKPAKPVPDGKAVKCPKCHETFKAGEEAAEKKPAAKAAAAADEEDDAGTYAVVKDEAEERKKAEQEERQRRKRERLKKKRKGEFDEDDEEEEAREKEEEDEEDIVQHYLRTVKLKDPRGPAQEVLVGPANWLLRTALIGFFGWLAYFIIFLIPIVFPTYDTKEDTSKDNMVPMVKEDPTGEKKKTKFKFDANVQNALKEIGMNQSILTKLGEFKDREYPSYEDFYAVAVKKLDSDEKPVFRSKFRKYVRRFDKYIHWWSAETILDEDTSAWSVPLFLFVLVLGIAQAGALAIGSVKMQSLESYNWSFVGCILALIPLTTAPLYVFLVMLFDGIDSLLEAGWTDITWMFGLVAFIWGPVVGLVCLKAFKLPQVRPGYDYKPE